MPHNDFSKRFIVVSDKGKNGEIQYRVIERKTKRTIAAVVKETKNQHWSAIWLTAHELCDKFNQAHQEEQATKLAPEI